LDTVVTVNVEKCLGCRSCEIACALVHSKSGVLEEAVEESPKPQRMVSVEAAGEFGAPIQCRHCEAAPCIEICPTGAIRRVTDEGPVIVEEQMCIGCKLCILICPFGVLRIGPEARAITKCDMCSERLEKGELPACVDACPTGALQLVSMEAVTKAKRRSASQKLAEQRGKSKGR